MEQWHRTIQTMIDEIDRFIREKQPEELTLRELARHFSYLEYHFSRKFREISGMQLREFDCAASGCELDTTPGRIFYFYHDCTQYWKYVRPVLRRL